MAECKTGCGKLMSYTQMRIDILNASEKHILAPVPLEMIYAVGVQESHGNRFFVGNEEQYFDNMHVFTGWTKLPLGDCKKLVTVNSGVDKGKMAKFRYEPSWKSFVDKEIGVDIKKKNWRQILHLSIGYFQKGQIFHLGAKPVEQWESAYEKFKSDPYEQIRVCANDLHILMQKSHGDALLALSRYNAGASIGTPTNYGKEVFQLYKNQLANQNWRKK